MSNPSFPANLTEQTTDSSQIVQFFDFYRTSQKNTLSFARKSTADYHFILSSEKQKKHCSEVAENLINRLHSSHQSVL